MYPKVATFFKLISIRKDWSKNEISKIIFSNVTFLSLPEKLVQKTAEIIAEIK